MAQGKYIYEDTQHLLERAAQILGEIPILDLTNWQEPVYINGDSGGSGGCPGGNPSSSSCSHILLRNIITITDTSIITCTGTATTTCSPIGTCPTGGIVSPSKYINIVAIVNLTGVAQTGVVIQFNYLINNTPVTDPLLTKVTVNLVPGNNTVYLFPTNRTYSPNTSITLYGASVISS